jgi:Protein of unknown function (DUF2808)
MSNNRIARKFLPCLALTGCLVAALPKLVNADTLPGFTIFSGVDAGSQLSYRLDNGARSVTDRYILKIPGSRINSLGAAQIQITYPDYYQGKFDEQKIEVLVDDKSIPLQSATWDREQRAVVINLAKQLSTKSEIQVVLGNVQNPDGVGTYYFNCLVKSSVDFPIARNVGTWILNIGGAQ